MKWKPRIGHLTLLGLTLGLLMGNLVGASAQEVYSLNVVGYYDVLLSPGWNVMTVQLLPGTNSTAWNAPNYNANAVLTNWPADGSLLYRFNPTNQSYYDAGTYLNGVGWYPLSGDTNDPALNLPPGEGFLVWTPQCATATILGEVPYGWFTNPVPAHFSLKAAMVPEAGPLTTDLAFPVQYDPVVWRCISPSPSYYEYDYWWGWGWDPAEPSLAVGEGFFVFAPLPQTWVRNFTAQFAPSLPAGGETAPAPSAGVPPRVPSLLILSFSLQVSNAVVTNAVLTVNAPPYNVQFASTFGGGFTTVATGQTNTVWQEPRRPGSQGYYRLARP